MVLPTRGWSRRVSSSTPRASNSVALIAASYLKARFILEGQRGLLREPRGLDKSTNSPAPLLDAAFDSFWGVVKPRLRRNVWACLRVSTPYPWLIWLPPRA